MPCRCLHLINERWTTPQNNNNKHSGIANQDLFAMGAKSNFGCDGMMLYGGQKCVYVRICVCVCSYSKPAMPAKTNQNKTQKNSPTNKNPSRTASLIINSNFTSPLTPCLIPYLFHHLLSAHYLRSFPFHHHTLPPSLLFPSISLTDSPACPWRI